MENWKRTFIIIWTGQLFSMLSSSVVGYAVVFWLSIKTGSAEVLAYAMMATLLPYIVLGMFAGVFVDRWDRKLTMILADSFIAVCTAVLCVMFYFGKVEIWQVYVLLALRSAGSAFHSPAMQASVPLLAPQSQLMRIAGVNQIIASISNIAGPALAALLITVMEMTYVLMFDIVGAVIACTSLLFVKIPNPEKKDTESERNILREIKEGLSAIFSVKGLPWLFGFDVLITSAVIPIAALFPLMTLNYFMGNTFQMSIIEMSWGVGMLFGGALLGIRMIKRANKIVLINITAIITGLTFVFSGILPPSGFVLFAALTGVGGIVGAVFSGAFTVVLQTKIDPAALGRVFSIYGSLTLLPAMPGLLATGYIADSIGLANAFVFAGIFITLLGLVLFMIPSVINLGRIGQGSNKTE